MPLDRPDDRASTSSIIDVVRPYESVYRAAVESVLSEAVGALQLDEYLNIDALITPDQQEVYTTAISNRLEMDLGLDCVRVFHGSPIDRPGSGLRWLRPAVVFDEQGASYGAHVLYVNCTPDEVEKVAMADVSVIAGSDINIKVEATNTRCFEELDEAVRGEDGRPKVVVRLPQYANINLNAMSVRPEVTRENSAVIMPQLAEMLRALGVDTEQQHIDSLLKPEGAPRELLHEDSVIKIFAPQVLDTRFGQFFSYDVALPHDPWKVYQIITAIPLDNLITEGRQSTALGRPPKVRIDSGCDCGEVYGDSLCDCSKQLHFALQEITNDARDGFPFGFIVHIPTQDGRGYGNAGKAETECYKNEAGGGKLHPELCGLDTAQAAFALYQDASIPKTLGEQGEPVRLPLDVRTYHGAARIMQMLGFDRVSVITSNPDKLSHTAEVLGVDLDDLKKDRVSAVRLEGASEELKRHVRSKLGAFAYLP